MTHVEVEERIEAPAAEVWDCYVGSRAEELVVSLFAERLTTEGEGAGSLRTTWLPDGAGRIVERIDTMDEGMMTCTYSVIDPGPFPFSNYRGRVAIEHDGADACIVRLSADFIPTGMSEADAVAQYRAHNLAGIERIREMLGSPQTAGGQAI